jgi:hypothetical protein
LPIVIRDSKTIASIRQLMRETGEGFHTLLGRLVDAEFTRLQEEEKRRKRARLDRAKAILETRFEEG